MFRYFGALGTARDLILAAFLVPGAAFWWSGRELGIYCNIAALAGLPGKVQNGSERGQGKVNLGFWAYPTSYKPVLQDYRTTGLQDYRTADLNLRSTAWWPQGGRRIFVVFFRPS